MAKGAPEGLSMGSSQETTIGEMTTGETTIEETARFTPRFDRDGLMTCVALDDRDGTVLMIAHMNADALRLTLETKVAHYWSRSRKTLWRKGDTSGQVQRVVEIRTDCDQDALVMRVIPGGDGGACHTGRRSCFYRTLKAGADGVALVHETVDGLEGLG